MPEAVELDHAPDLKRLYAKAAISTLIKGSTWPDHTLVRNDVIVDRQHLAEYNRVCGYGLTDHLPLTYPHIVAFPLAVELMAQPSFPLPLAGLVHIRNRITQRRALVVTEPLTVRVHLTEPRPHPKGRVFDIVAQAECAGEQVWESVSTNLQRGKGDDAADAGADLGRDGLRHAATWRVAKDTGRRYARVSGDINPIHLNRVTARLFGFPRPIAHGMWTKARALAALAERLPEACTAEVEFRKPLLLPATVELATRRTDAEWAFAVRARSGSAHVHGRVTDE
ncbi:MAG TPA: MaoC/PaaZ C-terminal domain-containing protein [Egibacteraceae bacterium]|nr:MaoC/PaaZ C-terminal domain-containing protein [Egibacteraceae bacterium]